jgi:hypothetical protein
MAMQNLWEQLSIKRATVLAPLLHIFFLGLNIQMLVVLFQAFQTRLFEIFGARCVETALLICDTLPKCARRAATMHMSIYWNFMWNTGAEGTGERHSTNLVALLVNVINCHTSFSKNYCCHTAIKHPRPIYQWWQIAHNGNATKVLE